MKPYLLITGILFTLVVIAHVARIFAEWPPSFTAQTLLVQSLTLLCAILAAWAFFLFAKLAKHKP